MNYKRNHRSILAFLSVLILLSSSPLFGADGTRGLGRVIEADSKSLPSLNQGAYRALIIGNDDYQDPKHIWKPLKTATHDASMFSTLLKKEYGFKDVTLLKNATRKQIFRAIGNLTDKAEKNDSILVYYAGHGWRNEATKEAYWIPVDAEGRDDSSYISNVRIKEKLSIIADKSAHTLLISDSCFSGTLLDTRGGNFSVKDTPSRAYFQKVSQRKSVQILAAGGKEYVDDNYRGSNHSPFTYFLINELKLNNQKYITLGNLALNIEQLVAKNSQQTPQSGAFRQAGDEGGQFVFAKLNINVNFENENNSNIAGPSNNQGSNELADWKKINTNDIQQVRNYIKKYPNGSITDLAKLKINVLNRQIDSLIVMAKTDIDNNRYALPQGQNALERYLAVLDIDSGNSEAKSQLEKLFAATSERVRKNIDASDFQSANKMLAQLQRIQPEISAHTMTIQNLQRELTAKQKQPVKQSDSKPLESDKQEHKNTQYVPSFNF